MEQHADTDASQHARAVRAMRRRPRQVLFALAAAFCAHAGPAAAAPAHDWLALLPACAMPEATVPSLDLLYPRAGLPAVVEAGALLVARVRLPMALTPPPGVQQSRVLDGFFGELVGAAIDLDARVRRPRYTLHVVGIRPDDARSLVYRLTLRVPAWLAPGTYDLRLNTAAGALEARGSVRVLEPGRPPRLARLGETADLARTAGLPVDAWLAPWASTTDAPAVATLDGAPLLALRTTTAALRIGDERLLVLGGCDGSYVRFDDQIAALLASEHRERFELPDDALSADSFAELARAARALPPRDAIARGRAGEGLRLAVADGFDATAELAVIVDGRQGARGLDGAARWFPAYEFARPAEPAAAVARVALRAGGQVTVRAPRASSEPATLRIESSPTPARAGESLRLRVIGAADPGARFAWQLDEELGAAVGGAELSIALRRPGLHAISGLSIGAHGSLQPARAEVAVLPARHAGCTAAARPAARRPAPNPAAWALCVAVLLLKRRGRSRPGIDCGRFGV